MTPPSHIIAVPPGCTSGTSRPAGVSLASAPLRLKGAVDFGFGKLLLGSVPPSRPQEDIYDGWPLLRPVHVPPPPSPQRLPLAAPSSRRAARHRRGGDAGPRGARGGRAALVRPLVEVASAGVHEEVADGGQLQAQLLRDGDLQLFGRAVVLPEDGLERAALQVREHQPGALGALVALQLALLLLLPLARCRTTQGGRKWVS